MKFILESGYKLESGNKIMTAPEKEIMLLVRDVVKYQADNTNNKYYIVGTFPEHGDNIINVISEIRG